MSGNFECYIVRDPRSKEVVYIGEGKTGRHKHVNSGVSNVYGLNKGHFDGIVWDLDIQLFDDKVSADSQETLLIAEHNPKFNIKKTARYDHKLLLSRLTKFVGYLVESEPDNMVDRTLFLHGLYRCNIDNKSRVVLKRAHFIPGVEEAIHTYGLDGSKFNLETIFKCFRFALIQDLQYLRKVIKGMRKTKSIQELSI